MSPRWCLEDILAYTFARKHTHTEWPTMLERRPFAFDDPFVFGSILPEPSQRGKVISFFALFLAVEPCGEANVIFVLHQLYVTIGKYSPPPLPHCRLPIM